MATDFGTLILNETPDAVIVTTPQGQVVCWTHGAAAVFGYTAEEALGRGLSELIVPAELSAEEPAIIARTLAQGTASYESLRHAKDGSLVYVDSSSKAVRGADGAVTFILWSKKDVTQLKVMRDAKLIEARFGGLLDSTPDAIVMSNASGRIVLANRQAELLFGFEHGQLRGALLECLLPERFRHAHVGHRNAYFSQARSRPMGAGRDLYGLRRDGAEFPVEISLSPISTEEGMLIMSAIRDISERKQIELTLQENNLALASANLAKDMFLASMSHELRTPLNAIIGFSGTLLMKLPGPLTDEQERQLRTIRGSARHLLALINDLLDLTKIESGKVELQSLPVECRGLIEELLLPFRLQASDKGLTLSFVCIQAELTLRSDRRAVQQILINLVNNAIKFTERGSVVVRLATELREGRPWVCISVRDTGVGIAAALRPKLFQAFTQLDAGTTRQYEGTGLGLYLSQKLAALLGGRILFDSEPGVGSSFTLALPLAAGDAGMIQQEC